MALIRKPLYDSCPTEVEHAAAASRARMSTDALAVIRRIRAERTSPARQPGEVCELCGEAIGDRHGHLVDLERRSLMCACRGCYLLFTPEGAGGGRFRAVPDRYVVFDDVRLSPAQWEAMQIPVSVAFFFVNSVLGQVAAFYPSPAGATESAASARHVGRGDGGQPRAGDADPGRRGVARPCRPGDSRRGVLPRADRRLLRARRAAAPTVEGLRRGRRGAPRRSTTSSPASGLGRAR